MKKFLFIVLLIFVSIVPTYCEATPRILIVEDTYQTGEKDTAEAGKRTVLINAKRKALEQCGTFITSKTTIKNLILEDDTVVSLAAGVMEVTELERKSTQVGEGMSYYIKIQAIIFPEKFEIALKMLENGMKPPLITKTNRIKNIITTSAENGNARMNRILLQAVAANDIDLAKTAIENGANVNIYYQNEYHTPLSLAVDQQNRQMVTCLLENSADVNAKIGTPGTIGKNMSPFAYAIQRRDTLIFKSLYDAGADINQSIGSNQFSVLTSAATLPLPIALERIQFLLENGADPNYISPNGLTPLMLECALRDHRQVEIIKKLLAAGANPKIKSFEGKLAIDYADKIEIIKLLEPLS